MSDPHAVAAEYSTEEAYRERSLAVRDLLDGPDDEDVLRERLLAARPRRLLDVGSGTGGLCVWAKAKVGAEVVALDSSARMVELAERAGVTARRADMRRMPFPDRSFDCVVASMCLYHVGDPDTVIGEAARVLTENGMMLASTCADKQPDRLHAWESLFQQDVPATPASSFSSENGRELLRRHFRVVEQIDCDSALVFPNRDRLVRYVKALPLARAAADQVPELTEPFRLPSTTTVFHATRPVLRGTARARRREQTLPAG